MLHPLHRIQRLRLLMEEVSRVEVEACAQRKQSVECKVLAWEEAARESRNDAFRGVTEANAETRMLAEACGALATWHGEQLEPVARVAEEALELSRDYFLDRRKERNQVEIVLDAAALDLARKLDRQEQRALDDWFNLRLTQQKRRARKLAAESSH